jgi:hypothetical protein
MRLYRQEFNQGNGIPDYEQAALEDVKAYLSEHGLIAVKGGPRGMYHCCDHGGHGFKSDCWECKDLIAAQERES